MNDKTKNILIYTILGLLVVVFVQNIQLTKKISQNSEQITQCIDSANEAASFARDASDKAGEASSNASDANDSAREAADYASNCN